MIVRDREPTPPWRKPIPSVWKGPHFRREKSPFHPRRPRVGKKTVPIVTLDNEPQDDPEVQKLAGSSQDAHADELEVLVCRPRQPGDDITFLSSQRTVGGHQPARLSPIKTEENEFEQVEGGILGSPSYAPPHILDDPEYGQPSDPLERCYSPPHQAVAKSPTVAGEPSGHPTDQIVKAQPVSNCNSLTSQEGVDSEPQEIGIQLPTAAARGNTLKAALICSPSDKTVKLSLSLPGAVSGLPSQTNVQSEVLPTCIVEHADFSET